jgi:phage major head subunit gpT-like protein
MPLLPEVLIRVEDHMQQIFADTYAALTANTWWSDVVHVLPSTGRREILVWLLSTATIQDQGSGGNYISDEMLATYTTIENRTSGSGLELTVEQLSDTDGQGFAMAAKWSSDIARASAYWPQEKAAHILNNGQTAALYTGYDRVALFSASHPVNPVDSSITSVYANLFTGGVSGIYPGALPISGNTLETAMANLSALNAYMASIPQPNARYPRRLRPVKMLVPPALATRATALTQAKFIATAAGSGAAQGGSTDVEGVIRSMGYGVPVVCDELGANFGGSDTAYYVVYGPMGAVNDQVGGIVMTNREPYSITYHGPMTSSELARKRKFQWILNGRNEIAPGHPYHIVKVLAT